jgi:hypothetical protein
LDSHSPSDPPPPEPPGLTPAPTPAQARFVSCRWQRPAEGDQPACCGHRDVLPMAGTTGFNPESWCGDCVYYKAKRAPKPRTDRPDSPRW